jgi:hypothetical protein
MFLKKTILAAAALAAFALTSNAQTQTTCMGCTVISPTTSMFNVSLAGAGFQKSEAGGAFSTAGTGSTKSMTDGFVKFEGSVLGSGGLAGPCLANCVGNLGQMTLSAGALSTNMSTSLVNSTVNGPNVGWASSEGKVNVGLVGQAGWSFAPAPRLP